MEGAIVKYAGKIQREEEEVQAAAAAPASLKGYEVQMLVPFVRIVMGWKGYESGNVLNAASESNNIRQTAPKCEPHEFKEKLIPLPRILYLTGL